MVQDDPKIAERRQKRQVKKAAEDAAGLTIAERLTRASKDDRINISMTDEDGEFVLEMREPLSSERIKLRNTVIGFEGRSAQDQEKAESEFAELLADFCVDESLNVDFWINGDYTPSKMKQIIVELMGTSEKQIQKAKEIIEAQSFRNK